MTANSQSQVDDLLVPQARCPRTAKAFKSSQKRRAVPEMIETLTSANKRDLQPIDMRKRPIFCKEEKEIAEITDDYLD